MNEKKEKLRLKKEKIIPFRVSGSLNFLLTRMAKSAGVSRSKVIRTILWSHILLYLDLREKKNKPGITDSIDIDTILEECMIAFSPKEEE